MSDFQPGTPEKLSPIQRGLLAITLWPMVYFVGLMPVECFESTSVHGWLGLLTLLAVSTAVGYLVWRFLKRGPFRSGTIVGFCAGFFLMLAMLMALLESGELVATFEDPGCWGPFEAATAEVVPDESHLTFGIASVSSSASQKSAFELCIDELHRQSETQAMRTEAIQVLSRTVSPDLAEDAVHDVMIKVCLKFEDGEVRELRPYFFKSIKYAREDLKKKRSRWRYCEYEEHVHQPWRPAPRQLTDEQHLQLVQAAMCRIDERQATVLRRHADGQSYQDIARALELSYDNVRQLHSRGIRSVRDELAKMNH
jgi:RNA polymerase sigma factor (sigma-70 family)